MDRLQAGPRRRRGDPTGTDRPSRPPPRRPRPGQSQAGRSTSRRWRGRCRSACRDPRDWVWEDLGFVVRLESETSTQEEPMTEVIAADTELTDALGASFRGRLIQSDHAEYDTA